MTIAEIIERARRVRDYLIADKTRQEYMYPHASEDVLSALGCIRALIVDLKALNMRADLDVRVWKDFPTILQETGGGEWHPEPPLESMEAEDLILVHIAIWEEP
ncbi:MAG: hypothetical protein A2Z21_09455 [Candidatus Fraserbacteria bacterium RBG_16_55_9]|uniref:Uncharacterized protein n=1 Tax=Fraserbacteria sp. (strain RBG_16_55_9) TaxID=1817864 RepID=A0A1F5UNP7_FRAXR|nr:MAG: hypothetical protein A2Z21_09455 [Candidatus Fraserbacteria bacterium RBG_16_55_9]